MYPTNLQDFRPSDCCGSREEDEDSEKDTGGVTYVDAFRNDDDDDDDDKIDSEAKHKQSECFTE